MAGNTIHTQFQSPQLFDLTIPAPIDSRLTIDSVAVVDVQIPQGVRYQGLFVWVQSEKRYYYFRDGITDSDFVPFSLGDVDDEITLGKFIFTSTGEVTDGAVLTHGLGSSNIIFNFTLNGEPCYVDYIPTENNENSEITLLLPNGMIIPQGLVATIIG